MTSHKRRPVRSGRSRRPPPTCSRRRTVITFVNARREPAGGCSSTEAKITPGAGATCGSVATVRKLGDSRPDCASTSSVLASRDRWRGTQGARRNHREIGNSISRSHSFSDEANLHPKHCDHFHSAPSLLREDDLSHLPQTRPHLIRLMVVLIFIALLWWPTRAKATTARSLKPEPGLRIGSEAANAKALVRHAVGFPSADRIRARKFGLPT